MIMSKVVNIINFSNNKQLDKLKEYMKSDEYEFDIRKIGDYPDNLEYTELRLNNNKFYNSINYAILYYMLDNAIKEGFTNFNEYCDTVMKEKNIPKKIENDPDMRYAMDEFLMVIKDTFKKDSTIEENKEYLYSYFDLISNRLSNQHVYIYFAGLVTVDYLQDLISYLNTNLESIFSIYSFPITKNKIDCIKNNMKPISHESILECGEFYFNLLFNYSITDFQDWLFDNCDLLKMPYNVKWLDEDSLLMVTDEYVPKQIFGVINDKFPEVDITIFSKVDNQYKKSFDVSIISKNIKRKNTETNHNKLYDKIFNMINLDD